ncbi:MAG TPA: hypothetical protein VD999_01480 [Vitreimonas sp.]|nr:hypothetical protein [Vitreimonas sp.]
MLGFLSSLRALKIINHFDEFFCQFPKLPHYLAETMVIISPFLVGISLFVNLGFIVQLIEVISQLDFKTILGDPVMIFVMLALYVLPLLKIFALVLCAVAVLPLHRREINGWIYLFWITFIDLLNVPFLLLRGDWVTIAITLVSMYLVMEIMPHYHDSSPNS